MAPGQAGSHELSFIQLGGDFRLALLGGAFKFRSFWRGRRAADEAAPPPAGPAPRIDRTEQP